MSRFKQRLRPRSRGTRPQDTVELPSYRTLTDLEIAITLGDLSDGDSAHVDGEGGLFTVSDGEPKLLQSDP